MFNVNADSKENVDTLNLSDNEDIKLLFENEGLANEKVLLSEMITKLNAKGKRQKRVLMITQKALYNLKPKKYKQSQRRIKITDIGMLTLSTLTPEFVIHVPSEYDYHMISKNKVQIAELLQSLYSRIKMSALLVVYSELQHLKDIVCTKKLAKYEDQTAKQTISKSMKNVFENVDPNAIYGDDEENKESNLEDDEHHLDLKEPGRYMSVQSQSVMNPPPPDENVAVYQSAVYGNDQLLLRQQQEASR